MALSNKEVIQGFEAAADTSVASMSFFTHGTLFALLFLLAAYVLFSVYKDLSNEGAIGIDSFLFSLARIGLLLSILGYVLS